MKPAFACLVLVAAIVATSHAVADTAQSLSARVGDAAFVSDDDGILLVPVTGTFTLSASTAGASAYPPPKTPIDRLSVTCDAYGDATSVKYDSAKFAQSNVCRASFTKGEDKVRGTPAVEYVLDETDPANLFEITANEGKVIEGRFQFTFKDQNGGTLKVVEGRYKAEDRQI